jgi:surfactin synthase thioesterase subunit
VTAKGEAVIIALGPPGAWPFWWSTFKREVQDCGFDVSVPVLRCRLNRMHEPPYRDVEELVDEVVADLVPDVSSYDALHLVGVCASSFPALAVAHRLASRVQTVAHLVKPPVEESKGDEQLETMSDAEFIEAAQRAKVLPDHASKNAELAKLVIPALRCDLRVMWRPAAAEPVGYPPMRVVTYSGSGRVPDWVTGQPLVALRDEVVAGDTDHELVVSRVLPSIVEIERTTTSD